MKLSICLASCLLVYLLLALQVEETSSRRGGGSWGRSSSSRSSSRSSSSRSSWGSSRRSSSSSSSSSSRRGIFSRIKDKVTGRKKKPSSTSSSSYPKQQWGTASGSSGSSSYPKQTWGAAAGGGAAGAAGSMGSSSYPKQTWGSSAAGGSVGSGSYPKQTWGSSANTPGNAGRGTYPGAAPPAYSAVGGGGFVNPGKTNSFGNGGGFSNNNFGKKPTTWGSNVASGGLGAAGGFAAGSMAKKYKYPKSSFFSRVRSKKHSYKPGYGTAWGTNFQAANMYKQKKGISKKALGLGVAAGFLGGAALGAAGTMATYSVYHRYQEFKNMMRMRGYGYMNDDDDYYQSYRRNECLFGCLSNSHCEWGFCECDYGFVKRYGQCIRRGAIAAPRAASFNPFISCSTARDCQTIDINMVCNTNLTVQTGGKCQCKNDMKWNEANGECQIFLDVDCSGITYDTPPSKVILDAVAKAKANNLTTEIPDEVPDAVSTPTIEESVNASLLSQLDSEAATANEIKEAYCRDVDAFSFDFDVDPQRPPACQPVPPNACGVVYDSHDCTGGWKLIITQGQISFPYFSSYWKYRNDIDLIGVKAGCTLTGYSNTQYTGQRGTFKAPDSSEFWWILSDYAEFQHLDEDIESIQCVCTTL